MLGPEGVTRGVFMHAAAALPGRLAQLRERYAATVGDLPDFASIYPDEISTKSIERFPALAVVIPNTTGQLGNRQTDVDATGEEYSYRYNIQLYSYAVADNEAETSKAIKRYTLAVREAFLADKILPVDAPHSATVDPRTLIESYSELDKRDSMFIAASMVQFEVVTHEWLAAPGSFDNTPATIELGTDIAPARHPYFDE
jgi:hypothetical protein